MRATADSGEGATDAAHPGSPASSTGVSAFDDVIGGGCPPGTTLLVKQDRATSYGNLLLRYFLAQGLVYKNAVMVISFDSDAAGLLKSLPRPVDGSAALRDGDKEDDERERDDTDPAFSENASQSDDLKIAWRYKPVSSFSTEVQVEGSGQREGKSGAALCD